MQTRRDEKNIRTRESERGRERRKGVPTHEHEDEREFLSARKTMCLSLRLLVLWK